jgi:hypothetical protein
MDSFAKEFEEAMAAVPQQILADALKKKLAAHGVKLSEKKVHLLAEKILNGEPANNETLLDHIKKRLGLAVKETVIEFTKDDFRAVEEALDEFVGNLPQTVEDVTGQTSSDLLQALK